jgi:hypothetical protein
MASQILKPIFRSVAQALSIKDKADYMAKNATIIARFQDHPDIGPCRNDFVGQELYLYRDFGIESSMSIHPLWLT